MHPIWRHKAADEGATSALTVRSLERRRNRRRKLGVKFSVHRLLEPDDACHSFGEGDPRCCGERGMAWKVYVCVSRLEGKEEPILNLPEARLPRSGAPWQFVREQVRIVGEKM